MNRGAKSKTSSLILYSCPAPLINIQVSTNQTLSERQPNNFGLEIKYKPRGIYVYSVDVLVLMVSALASLAVDDFNDPIVGFNYDLAGLRLKFSGTREPGRQGYQTKTVMWSIRLLSCWLYENHYAEVSFYSKYDDGLTIGVGQLLSVALAGQQTQGHSVNTSELAVGEPSSSLQKRIEDEILVGDIGFADEGASFEPFHIYTLFMNILIAEGERNPDDYSVSVTGYLAVADLSFAMGARDRARAVDFPNKYVVKAIEDLAQRLASVRERELKWKECTFAVYKVGRGRRKIGLGVLKKGRMGPSLSELWSNATTVEPVVVS